MSQTHPDIHLPGMTNPARKRNVPTTWHPNVLRLFEAFFRPWMNRRIAHIYTAGRIHVESRAAVILASNHVSWWDGFLLRDVHRRYGGDAPLFTLMLKREWYRSRFVRYVGGIPLDGSVSGVRGALSFLRDRRREGPCWVVVTPQGRIYPSFKRPLDFQRGVELFAKALHPCVVVPVAIHCEPLNKPGMSVFIGIGGSMPSTDFSVLELERSVSGMLDTLVDLLAEHGEGAGSVWVRSGTEDLRCP